ERRENRIGVRQPGKARSHAAAEAAVSSIPDGIAGRRAKPVDGEARVPPHQVVRRNAKVVEVVGRGRGRHEQRRYDGRADEATPGHGDTSLESWGAKIDARRSGSTLPPETIATTAPSPRPRTFPASSAAVAAAPEPST